MPQKKWMRCAIEQEIAPVIEKWRVLGLRLCPKTLPLPSGWSSAEMHERPMGAVILQFVDELEAAALRPKKPLR